MTKKHYTHTLSHSGFTLIELLITIVIIGILSTLGIVAFQSTQKKSQDLGRKTNLKTVSKALETYMNDKGVFPPSSPDGKILWCGTEAAPDAVACPWGYPLTDVATAGEDKTVYLAALPKDSNPAQTFFYEAVEIDGINKGYRLYAKLENIKDPDIPASGQYATNCGATTTHYCNYVLASETVPAPSPYVIIITPTNTPIPTNIPTPISTPIPTVQQCLASNGTATTTPNSVCEDGGTVSVQVTGYTGTVLRWEYSLNNGAWQTWAYAGSQTTVSWSIASGYRFRAVLQNNICTEYSTISATSSMTGKCSGDQCRTNDECFSHDCYVTQTSVYENGNCWPPGSECYTSGYCYGDPGYGLYSASWKGTCREGSPGVCYWDDHSGGLWCAGPSTCTRGFDTYCTVIRRKCR